MVALEKSEALDLVEFPSRINTIERKWVFKEKLIVEGKVKNRKPG